MTIYFEDDVRTVTHRSRSTPMAGDLPPEVLRHLAELFDNSLALNRAVSTIETLALHELPVDRQTLAAEIDVGPGALDRVLMVLVEYGYVLRTGRFGTSLGPRFLVYQERFPAHLSRTVSPLVVPYLTEFAEGLGSPVYLAVPVIDQVVVTDAIGLSPADIQAMPGILAVSHQAAYIHWLAPESEFHGLRSMVWSAPAAPGWRTVLARVSVSNSYACVGMLLDSRAEKECGAACDGLLDLSQRLSRALGRRFPKRE